MIERTLLHYLCILISGVCFISLALFLTRKNKALKVKINELTEENFNKTILEHELRIRNEFLEKELFQKNSKDEILNAFDNLSHKTLNEQTNSFLQRLDIIFDQMNQKYRIQTQEFSKVVEPVLKSIEHFKEQNINMEQERAKSHFLLHNSIGKMNDICLKLREQMNLLTSSGKMSGQWGELQLRRLLEMTGLIPYCDFLEQYHMVNEETLLRPDVLINLPNNIFITIDAKTSLSSYIKYQKSIIEEDQKKYKKEYYKSIKNHINSLGSKKYWSQFTSSPEMVIMFLPGEDFWRLAVNEDEEIIEYAYNMNVIVTTPLTLIPLLKIIAILWSKFKISMESELLRQDSLDLCEKFIKISDLLSNMTRPLEVINQNFKKLDILQNNMKNNLENFTSKYFPLLTIKK